MYPRHTVAALGLSQVSKETPGGPPMRTHSVIIATCARPNLLERALISVSGQHRTPDRILIIDDSPQPDLHAIRALGNRLGLRLEVLANRRTKGASGAWNTGLDHLARDTSDPTSHSVSILDDDDWWEPDYLQLVAQAFHTGADVVAGALARHDDRLPEGRLMRPPETLAAGDFLVGNPGIQGSNLSARLSTLLQAGLFDEALTSCTDRDLCIRLADLGAIYKPARGAVAHHDCLHGRPRISDPGTDTKIHGLDVFFAKWRRRMTPEQWDTSTHRARQLFAWTPTPDKPAPTAPVGGPANLNLEAEPLRLVVGTIVDGSNPHRCLPLIDGLAALSAHPLVASLDMVLLENGDAGGFARVGQHARALGLSVWLAELADQHRAAPALNLHQADITRCKPIAIARTLLQRFVFEVSQARNHAPAWILDDDFRLPHDHDELVAAMIACRDGGIDVALGGNSGAAPVPASSLLRTQLVDLVHLLTWASMARPEDMFPDADAANRRWLEGRQDVHYDLSRHETDRLETPFLPSFSVGTLAEGIARILKRAERILAGEPITRPVPETPTCRPEEAKPSCWRGGNTFITDTTLLRDIPNTAPRVDGRPTRRSDMIWAANALYRFGKTVKAIRLPMYHDRSTEPADEDDTRRLVDDILGYGFFSAYAEVLRSGHSEPLTAEERRQIHDLTRKYTLERLAAYRLSFWRALGLKRALENLVVSEPWWLRAADQDVRTAFDRFRDLLERTLNLTHLQAVENSVCSGMVRADIDGFLSDMDRIRPDEPLAKCDFLHQWVQGGRHDRARSLVTTRLGRDDSALLGMGAEGVVLRTGDRVVKVFDRWTPAQRRKAAALLAELIQRPTNFALPTVLATHDWPEAFALEYTFEDSVPYAGGYGPELVAMLQDLRRSGWVHSNVSPKNLRLTARGLQLIDLGKSLEPASPRGEEMMIRRAFLSWRFAGRADLVSLMRRSLATEHVPELTGWRALFEAVTEPPTKRKLDEFVRDRIDALAPSTVLDYGCGKPRGVAQWPDDRQLTAFDVDQSLRDRWSRDAPQARFWDEGHLAGALAEGQSFDVVICSLVLCAVDGPMMAQILANLRRLSANGRIIVAVCDPAAIHLDQAVGQTRHGTAALDPALPGRYLKSVAGSPTPREEFHRSIEAYRRAFARSGLRVIAESPVGGFDAQRLERAPEFLVFELEPLPQLEMRTSLLIKLCAMEAETALHQVRHLERQLGRPRAFDEIVLLIDPHEGPFPRAHSPADLSGLERAVARLQDEGIVDRVMTGFTDGAAAAQAARHWAICEAPRAHCANGQPATAILAAIETCQGEYVLHVDADVLVARPDPSFDHIADAVGLMEANPEAVTLALAVHGDTNPAVRLTSARGPYRVEAICGWISKRKLAALRPLSGGAEGGRLNLPWHRMVDLAVREGRAASLRRGSTALWWTAVDNLRKARFEAIDLLMGRMEAGFAPPLQAGQPLVSGTMSDWLGPKRTELMVVVVCGRNVRPGTVERCFSSLRTQSHQEWGAVVIDDASDEPCREAVRRECAALGERVTLLHRHRRVGLLANTFTAIREFVQSPDAVIVLVDLDDALAHPDALLDVASAHHGGADLTVGSMLRTDKDASYPVDFTDPRGNRGGNVWQHLRTFRKSLFERIQPADLEFDGAWIDLANDWAYMLPLTEMAEHPVWLHQKLYLHEPSTTRPPDEKVEREAVVSRIVAKPSYRRPRAPEPQVTVLCYHRILGQVPEQGPDALFHRRGMAVTAANLRAQIADALRHFEPIRIPDVLAAQRGERALPERALLVTVDDGYRDFATHGLPVMLRAGIEPVLFARAPGADGLPTWAPLDLLYVARGLAGVDTPFPDPGFRARLLELPIGRQIAEVEKLTGIAAPELAHARRNLYLSEADLRQLPGMALGYHGVEHERWTNLDDTELDLVLGRCKEWLKGMGAPYLVVAYPDGAVDRRVAARLQLNGVDAAFAIDAPMGLAPAFAWSRVIMADDPHQLAQGGTDQREEVA